MDGIPGGGRCGRCGLDVFVLLPSVKCRGSEFACLVVMVGWTLLLALEVLSLEVSKDVLTLFV